MSEYVLFDEELLRNFYDPTTCSYMVPLSGKAAHDMGVLRQENAGLKTENTKLKVENAHLRKLLQDVAICASGRYCYGCPHQYDGCDRDRRLKDEGIEVD